MDSRGNTPTNAAEHIRTQSHTLAKSFVLREIRRACFVLLPRLPLSIPHFTRLHAVVVSRRFCLCVCVCAHVCALV